MKYKKYHISYFGNGNIFGHVQMTVKKFILSEVTERIKKDNGFEKLVILSFQRLEDEEETEMEA
jgi:hypothetical protein